MKDQIFIVPNNHPHLVALSICSEIDGGKDSYTEHTIIAWCVNLGQGDNIIAHIRPSMPIILMGIVDFVLDKQTGWVTSIDEETWTLEGWKSKYNVVEDLPDCLA